MCGKCCKRKYVQTRITALELLTTIRPNCPLCSQSVCPGQWHVFCTPSLAIILTHCIVNLIQIWRIWRPHLKWDKFWSFCDNSRVASVRWAFQVSQKWKAGNGRQYFKDIICLFSTTVTSLAISRTVSELSQLIIQILDTLRF